MEIIKCGKNQASFPGCYSENIWVRTVRWQVFIDHPHVLSFKNKGRGTEKLQGRHIKVYIIKLRTGLCSSHFCTNLPVMHPQLLCAPMDRGRCQVIPTYLFSERFSFPMKDASPSVPPPLLCREWATYNHTHPHAHWLLLIALFQNFLAGINSQKNYCSHSPICHCISSCCESKDYVLRKGGITFYRDMDLNPLVDTWNHR